MFCFTFCLRAKVVVLYTAHGVGSATAVFTITDGICFYILIVAGRELS